MNARTQAIARQDREIEESTARAVAAREAQRKPRSALEAMANRLEMSPANLQRTLMATVFKDCRNDSEFAALVVVANEYGLNPLLKEIYAFPAKGGGVVPMVGVDGWIRLMNEHPQFDGIEFGYHDDANGKTVAIEAMIYRKDRSHPIKVIEYMEECKGNTAPWQKSPRRMLRHRALIQGARIAFGFSGIAAEGDEETIDGGEVGAQPIPTRKSFAEELDDEIPAFDQQTGEVYARDPQTGVSQVDEETARQLDAAQDGEAEVEEADYELPAWHNAVQTVRKLTDEATDHASWKKAEAEFLKIAAALPDDTATELEKYVVAKRTELQGKGA